MASKTTENNKRRTRKAASVPAPVVLDPRQYDNGEDKTQDLVPVGKPPVSATPVSNLPISNLEEQIRRRAYELYLERGGTSGDAGQDWLVAEQQVRSRQMQDAR